MNEYKIRFGEYLNVYGDNKEIIVLASPIEYPLNQSMADDVEKIIHRYLKNEIDMDQMKKEMSDIYEFSFRILEI